MVRRIFAFEGNGAVVQYEGGFTDYQAAWARKHPEGAAGGRNARGGSGGGDAGKAGAAGAGKAGAGSAGAGGSGNPDAGESSSGRTHQKKLKFSFKEQREWDTIEDEIAALEDRISELDAQIEASATVFGKLNQLMEEKAETEARLEEKMERWMYLNELAERIAGEKG